MEIDFLPMLSWALVSTNKGESNNIPPMEPIKLHSVPEWGHTLMNQLHHTAVEINSLHCQIQGDETEAYHEEQRQKLLRDFAQQMEANQNVWIAYHKDQAAKQEKFNDDCQ
jgi:hypothetical protein